MGNCLQKYESAESEEIPTNKLMINIQDKNGDTLLMRSFDKYVIENCIELKADPNILNNRRKNAMSIIFKNVTFEKYDIEKIIKKIELLLDYTNNKDMQKIVNSLLKISREDFIIKMIDMLKKENVFYLMMNFIKNC